MSKFNLFTDMKKPRDVTGYTLFRGTTDWTQLQQFDLFEQGYPYLVMVNVPDFLLKMADADPEVKTLIDSYRHIIEYEFLGFDNGIEDITSDSLEISNNIQQINVLGKTTGGSGTTFSMEYNERAGSTLTKLHELYLRSVRDTSTQFKTYNGLIGTGDNAIIKPSEVSFQKETFSFLYMHTDSTGLELEQAIYIVGAWPTTAQLSIYQSKKGDVAFAPVSCEFQGFPIRGSAVNAKAKEILDWMNSSANNMMVHRNSWDYNYAGLTDTASGLAQTSLTSN